MADQVDIACEQEAVLISSLLAERVQYSGESAQCCEDCGDDIPEPRRAGVPGVKTCVACQALRERDRRLLR